MGIPVANTVWFTAGSSGTADFSDGAALAGYRNIAGAAASLTNGVAYSYRAEHPTDKSIWENGSGAVNTGTNVLARTTIAESSTGAKVNFAVAPVIILVPMKRDFDLLAPLAAMAAHNVVVNPAVDVSQELGTTGATLTNNTAKYTADLFEGMYNHGAATAVVTSGQVVTSAFSGFGFGHQLKATTALTAPANGDFAKHRHKIIGYNIAHWGFGAAGASSIVVAGQLFSTASGTGLIKLSNSDQSRCYYHEVTVAAGVTFFAFTVPGDTTGTWGQAATVGMVFEFFACGKETTPVSALDAWGATNKVQSTNSGNLLGTNNNLTILTGLYIDAGTQLPVQGDLPALMRNAREEKLRCQCYFTPAGSGWTGTWETASRLQIAGTFAEMVAAPTVALIATNPTVAEVGVADRTASGATIFTSNRTQHGARVVIDGFSSATANHGAISLADLVYLDARL